MRRLLGIAICLLALSLPISVNAQMVGRAQSSEQTAATTGKPQNAVTDLVGKLIVLPYANPENFVSGVGSATDTSRTAIIASAGGSLRNYLTGVTCANSSATSITVSIQDNTTEKWVLPVPATGGAVQTFLTPLRGTAATAWNFVASTGVTTLTCSGTGYKGQ